MRQADWARALLTGDEPAPQGLLGPSGQPAPWRFEICRNGVVAGLVDVLAQGFPVVRGLVGEAFFAAMAREFIAAHPPKTRSMALYGDEFAGFLQGFAPLAALQYVPDVARLEQGLRLSYHAADAPAMPEGALIEIADHLWPLQRLTLAPAVQVIASDWPIHAIWQGARAGGGPVRPGGQSVLILRPVFDPVVYLIPAEWVAIIAGWRAGQCLSDLDADAVQGVELAALVAILARGQAITAISALPSGG